MPVPHRLSPALWFASRTSKATATGVTDGVLGRWLMAFLLALYLITGSGHGYSPDGEFAFRLARSLLIDPDHAYLKVMLPRLSHWGFVGPALAQPLVLAGEPLIGLMPQKDHLQVDGNSFVLGYYHGPGLPDEAPTTSAEGGSSRENYRRGDLPGGRFTSLAVISFLTEAPRVPQGATVATITLVGSSGEEVVLPLRAGVETAQWNLARGGVASHGMARVASTWSGNTAGRNYYARLPFDGLEPGELRVRYLAPEGRLYVRSLALIDEESGRFQLIPSEQRFWTERENADFFARLFHSPYNAIVTAAGCVLLFALARILGYGRRVSVALTLLYGLGTLAWPYSKYDFSEPTLATLVLASLYLILRWGQEGGRRWLLAAGMTALMAAGTKYAAGVIVPFLALQILLLHREKHPGIRGLPGAVGPLLLFGFPFIVVAAPTVWFLSQRVGYWPWVLEAWDGMQRGWFPLPFWIGLQGLLFSPGRSFFLYSPPTLLALLSVVPFVRRHGVRAVGLLGIVLFYFGPAYSMKVAWHAGAGWGPRYQVLIIPLVILMVAPLVQKAIEGRNRWARYALLATFMLGAALQLLAVSKSYDVYLGMFRYEIVTQLPDQGAQYGGADYYPYAGELDNGNAITATLWAWPFSPILAQAWLLSGDLLAAAPSFPRPLKEGLLAYPPWRLWGIDVLPAHPEHGLGTDFWSLRLRTDFPAAQGFLAGAFLVLLLLEAILLAVGARLISFLFAGSPRRPRAVKAWLALAALALLLFDGIHLLV